jgi:hypothetical protein
MNNTEVEVRIGKLEAIAQTQAQISLELQRDMKSLGTRMDAGFEKFSSEVHSMGKTDWRLLSSIVIGAIGIGLTCVTVIVTLGILVLAPLNRDIERIMKTVDAHITSEGHPDTRAELEANRERLDRLFSTDAELKTADEKIRADVAALLHERFTKEDGERLAARAQETRDILLSTKVLVDYLMTTQE